MEAAKKYRTLMDKISEVLRSISIKCYSFESMSPECFSLENTEK